MEELIYELKKKEALVHAEDVKQKQELYKLKHSNDKPKERLSFGKIGFIFLVVNFTVVEIYSLIMMAILQDLTPLPSLIAAVIGNCISFITYNIKSQHENTQGGIVYETAMMKLEHELNEEDSVG